MKKNILTFSFAALGMMTGAFAQDVTFDFPDMTGGFGSDFASDVDLELAKVDTIDYIADKVQNWYLGASIGISHSMGENTRFDNIIRQTRPSFRFEIGKNLYPQFGIRMLGGWLNQRGRCNFEVADYLEEYGEKDGNYDFTMAALFVDGVFDFHSIIFGYKEERRFSLKGYVGLGGFYTFGWDEDKLKWLSHPTYKDCTINGVHHKQGDPVFEEWAGYDVDYKNRLYLAGHVGLIADYRITDSWSVNVDVSFNGTDDGYNGIRYRRVYDSYIDGYVGLTYRFKDKGQSRLTYVHFTDQALVDDLNRQIQDSNDSLAEARKPIVVQRENVSYNEMLQTTVSFYIDKTFVTDAQKRNVRSVAKFLETHPDLDLVICGYADVQTAYPKYNMMLSQKRAQAVYEILTKEYGVDPTRLSMDYKGDEEQPFAIVNEWNRAVVFYIKPHEADFEAGVQDKADKIRLNSHESGRLHETDSQKTRRP